MDRIRLIATDLDETLLINHIELPPDFERTVRALAAEGIYFAAASGRPLCSLEKMFASLKDVMIFIGDNGGAASLNGEMLYVREMPPEDWRMLARAAKEAGDVGVLCGLNYAYVEKQYEKYDAVLKPFYADVCYVDRLEDADAVADKFTIYLPKCDSQRAYDEVYSAYAESFSVAVAGAEWVDVMNKGVHKGSALVEIGRRLGIDTSEMMAFGDTFNDAEMLKTARYGFLMANGSPELRAEVPFIAPSNLEYGVAQIAEKVLAQKGLVSPEDFARP